MTKIIQFNTHEDSRGFLTVIEKDVPFDIKRIFYIYGVDNSKRGFHKHKKTRQIVICLNGTCDILIEKERIVKYSLKNPDIGLLIEPDDYHWMENFSEGSILLVLASKYYDKDDYIKNK